MSQNIIQPEVTLKHWHRHPERTLFKTFPQLNSIWQPDLAELAAFHSKQWEIDLDESGDIFTAHVGEAIIGVTGWYRLNRTEAGLRWHGVIPEARRCGYSRQMIDLVCKKLPPKINKVYEVTRNVQSRHSFCLCGFEVISDPNIIRRIVREAEYDIEAGGWVLLRTL